MRTFYNSDAHSYALIKFHIPLNSSDFTLIPLPTPEKLQTRYFDNQYADATLVVTVVVATVTLEW